MTELPAIDLEAALRDLDRATRRLSERLGKAAIPGPPPPDAPAAGTDGAEPDARAYVEDAKRRADALIGTLIAAVERDAATLRSAAEAEAECRIEEARQLADRMVADRRQRIAEVSDRITERAQTLSAAMDDAARIGAQFDAFLRALSAAAARIAADDEQRPIAIGHGPGGLRDPGSLAA